MTFAPNSIAVYSEDGSQARVKVLEDTSEATSLRYKIEVLEVYIPHPVLGPLRIGQVLDLWQDKEFSFCGMWTLVPETQYLAYHRGGTL